MLIVRRTAKTYEEAYELYRIAWNAKLAKGFRNLSFKYGTEERISGERTFSDYTEKDIPWLLGETQMECLEYWISGDVREDHTDEKWLNILAKKML